MITNRKTQSEKAVTPDEYSSGLERDGSHARYVIQRTSETIREWWTGTGWTDDFNQALQYDHKPDVSVETLDEMARAVSLDEIDD